MTEAPWKNENKPENKACYQNIYCRNVQMQPRQPEQRELLSTGILQKPFKVYHDVYSMSNRAKSQTGRASFKGAL